METVSVGPVDKGGSREGQVKADNSSLGELGARLQGGRKDHDIQSDSVFRRERVKQRRCSEGCGLAEHGVRVASATVPADGVTINSKRWRGGGQRSHE